MFWWRFSIKYTVNRFIIGMRMDEKVYVFTVCYTENSRVVAGFIIKIYFTKLVDCQPEIQNNCSWKYKIIITESSQGC